MASRSKKTTFAKLNREAALRERRLEKQHRKEARKRAAALENESEARSPEPTTDEPQSGGSHDLAP
jgi:hypothetical protein